MLAAWRKKNVFFLGGHFFNLGEWRGLIEGFFWGWENSFFIGPCFGAMFFIWRMDGG